MSNVVSPSAFTEASAILHGVPVCGIIFPPHRQLARLDLRDTLDTKRRSSHGPVFILSLSLLGLGKSHRQCALTLLAAATSTQPQAAHCKSQAMAFYTIVNVTSVKGRKRYNQTCNELTACVPLGYHHYEIMISWAFWVCAIQLSLLSNGRKGKIHAPDGGGRWHCGALCVAFRRLLSTLAVTTREIAVRTMLATIIF